MLKIKTTGVIENKIYRLIRKLFKKSPNTSSGRDFKRDLLDLEKRVHMLNREEMITILERLKEIDRPIEKLFKKISL